MPATSLSPLAISALALLHERRTHPYEASQLLALRRRDRVVKITAGSLYRTFERLAEDGLAEVVGVERAGNRPERTVYAITDAGRSALRASVESMLAEPDPGYPALPFALSEAHNLTAARALDTLERRLVAQRVALDDARAVAAGAEELAVPELYILDVDYRISALQHEIAWIEQLVARIRDGELDWRLRLAPDWVPAATDSPTPPATVADPTRSDPQEAALR